MKTLKIVLEVLWLAACVGVVAYLVRRDLALPAALRGAAGGVMLGKGTQHPAVLRCSVCGREDDPRCSVT